MTTVVEVTNVANQNFQRFKAYEISNDDMLDVPNTKQEELETMMNDSQSILTLERTTNYENMVASTYLSCSLNEELEDCFELHKESQS